MERERERINRVYITLLSSISKIVSRSLKQLLHQLLTYGEFGLERVHCSDINIAYSRSKK